MTWSVVQTRLDKDAVLRMEILVSQKNVDMEGSSWFLVYIILTIFKKYLELLNSCYKSIYSKEINQMQLFN